MCGFYIHGRSWMVGVRDLSEEDVVLVEEEGVLETLNRTAVTGIKGTTNNWWRTPQTGKVLDAKLIKKMQDMFDNAAQTNMSDMMDAFLYGKPKYLAVDPAAPKQHLKYKGKPLSWAKATPSTRQLPDPVKIEYNEKTQVPIYKHYCKRMECNTHNSMPAFRTANNSIGEITDWGIRPSDGKIVKQRGEMTKRLEISITGEDWMPATQKELLEWCDKHWGKNGDTHEWEDSAPRCLDGERFLSFVPPRYKFGIADCDANKAGKDVATQLLFASQHPTSTFAEMLKDAPNDYWKGK